MHLHSHAHGSPTAPPPSKKSKAAGRSARLPAARPRPLPVLAGTALGVSDAVGGSGSLPDGRSDRPAGWQRPAVLPRAEYEPGRLLGPLSLVCDALPFRGTSGWPRWDGGQPPRRGSSRTAPGSAASHPPGAPTATAWRAPSSERRCAPHPSWLAEGSSAPPRRAFTGCWSPSCWEPKSPHASPRLGPGGTGERGAFRFPRRGPPSHAARAASPLRPGHRRRAGSGLPFPTCPLLSPRAAVVPGGTVSGTFGEPVV